MSEPNDRLPLVEMMMSYEAGELSEDDTLALFAELVRTGLAWQLQGSYVRAAASLIQARRITVTGEVIA